MNQHLTQSVIVLDQVAAQPENFEGPQSSYTGHYSPEIE